MDKSPIIKIILVRPFLYLWLGQIFSQLAINMVNFILLLKLGELTKSNLATSIFVLSIGIPSLLFGSLAGVLADSFDKKRILIISNFSRAAVVLAFVGTSHNVIWVYILAFLAASLTQFFMPAQASLIPFLAPKELLLSANSLVTLTFFVTIILGFFLSGPVYLVLGNNIFILAGLFFLAATLTVKFLPKITMVRAAFGFGKIGHELKEAYLFLISSRSLSAAFFLLASSQILIATVAALAPGFAREVQRISVEQASILLVGPAALGMILGALVVGSVGQKFPRSTLITTGIFLAGICLMVFSLVARSQKHQTELVINGYDISLLSSLVLLFLLGVANALVDVCANAVLQEESRQDLRSRVYGFLTAIVGFFSIFPVLFAGLLSDYFGVVKVLFMMGVGILGYGIFRFARREVR